MTLPGRLLVHTVTIEPYLGEGAYGPAYDPPFTSKARVTTRRQLVRDTQGDEVVSESTVILPPGTQCSPESRVTLPGEDSPRTVLTSASKTGAREVHHVEVTTK